MHTDPEPHQQQGGPLPRVPGRLLLSVSLPLLLAIVGLATQSGTALAQTDTSTMAATATTTVSPAWNPVPVTMTDVPAGPCSDDGVRDVPETVKLTLGTAPRLAPRWPTRPAPSG